MYIHHVYPSTPCKPEPVTGVSGALGVGLVTTYGYQIFALKTSNCTDLNRLETRFDVPKSVTVGKC